MEQLGSEELSDLVGNGVGWVVYVIERSSGDKTSARHSPGDENGRTSKIRSGFQAARRCRG
jgi:hypothetical protein